MSFITSLLSPLNLLFFVILMGFAVSKICFKGVSLGIAGVLFVSMIIGFWMNFLIPEANTEIVSTIESKMKIFSQLGSSLFVSVIGLQTGFSIKNNSRGSVIAFIIGSLMSLSGVIVMLLIACLDKEIGYTPLLGVLCGALTSTPGLSSVCELVESGAEKVVLGYGGSYLLGVVFVVFSTQILRGRARKKENEKNEIEPQNIKGKIYPELTLICATALFGNIVGNVKITFLGLSLGTTASTLMIGLLIGWSVHKSTISKGRSLQYLNILKNLGLALFFAGTGFATGIQTILFDIKTVLYGALITFTAILCGWLLCKIPSTQINVDRGFIIAGGMTSSPAYGAIDSDATEESINCFSFAYFGAMITLIVALAIIV